VHNRYLIKSNLILLHRFLLNERALLKV